ncbi:MULTISPECIES: ABC transporter ATP-binding protein [Corynebacterium]|jgi:sulfonate transport system ATP-binding protein|uniref:Aliphatic sulfonates import ATP-binding protein SsuB n=1 Tax=Corynebacterium provencense TaxID=1737425 RepID=A0A2Z3YSH1_9CORY|nr:MULTISPECIES: ABC transporter ATP-binding protein [Corynebacterium]AWT26611.1 Aliphatic sulfonates import ATP-binding protein SsuB [Corynebacterium provencense]MCI1257343.1 ABC transporter ATP-binding protein [Corynebacterium provencense]
MSTVTQTAAETRTSVIVDGVTRSFGGRRILDGVSFTVEQGEFVALLGRSGGGKSTILRILAGLETADSGTVLTRPNRTIVFQEPRLVRGRKVWDNITVGIPGGRRERRRQASAILSEVGLEGFGDAWPTSLSGGEAQRVALARALIRSPELLLLDEPFGALDALTRLKIQSLVAALHGRHNPSVLLVTHDVDEAILLADRILVLRDGGIGAEYRVPFGRRRSRSLPGFSELRGSLLGELGVSEEIGVDAGDGR